MRRLAKDAFPDLDPEAMDSIVSEKFMEGLPREVSLHVQLQNYETYDELVSGVTQFVLIDKSLKPKGYVSAAKDQTQNVIKHPKATLALTQDKRLTDHPPPLGAPIQAMDQTEAELVQLQVGIIGGQGVGFIEEGRGTNRGHMAGGPQTRRGPTENASAMYVWSLTILRGTAF
jgi:hypothetical protein